MHMMDWRATLHSLSSRAAKIKTGKGSNGPFDLRSAFIIAAALTALLWWIPVFGQMIAGYVGGRKSGSAARGVLVAGSAVGMFIVIALLFSLLGFSVYETQEYLAETVLAGVPVFSGLMLSLADYASSTFSSFGALGSFCAVVAVATVVFGLIGGIVAGQIRLEMQYRTPSGVSAPAGAPARSVDAFKKGRSMGFGSFEEYSSVHAAQVSSAAGPSSEKPLVRRASARDAPEPRPAAETKPSPLSSVLEMAGSVQRAVQPREKPAPAAASFDDTEFI